MRGLLASQAFRSCLIALTVWTLAPQAGAEELTDVNPIIFVHGGAGSGAQFESQALRFTSNGYPQKFIHVLEYDSSAIQRILPEVHTRLDALIEKIQAETGKAKVDLIGHSLGTFVSQTYLSTPERAANVGHYVNVDGRPATALPGGVATLALFAGAARKVQGQIVGATNVTLPDQEHIQAATSPEAFVEMFRFFTGKEPSGTTIVPATSPFEISGRAVLFPQNSGVGQEAKVQVWRLDSSTGQRVRTFFGLRTSPAAVLSVDADGNFGPFLATPGQQYEFTIVRPNAPDHRFFFEPFLRGESLVRLHTGVPGQGIDANIERSPAHVALTITRNKEFRGDRSAAENDVLSINGQNVINPTTARSGFVGSPAAQFLFDVGSDRVSHLETVPNGFGRTFFAGADLFIAAERGAVTIQTVPRGNTSATRTLRIPNVASTEARVTVVLSDFEQGVGVAAQ